MSLGYNSPSVTCWYLVRLLSLSRCSCLCSKYCSVWKQSWLWFSFFCQFTAIPPSPKKMHSFEFQVYSFLVFIFIIYHDIIRFIPLGSSSITGVVKGWMAPVDSLWFERTLPCGHTVKKKKKMEIVLPLVSTDFGVKSLSHNKSEPLTVGFVVCASVGPVSPTGGDLLGVWILFLVWLVSGCFVGGVIIVFFSCYWNKALERFLVFTGAQRRPGRGRSSGGGEARCGRPWGSRASAPVRSPQHCRWWTDGPCSSWLL